jgi:hypothetical protein
MLDDPVEPFVMAPGEGLCVESPVGGGVAREARAFDVISPPLAESASV